MCLLGGDSCWGGEKWGNGWICDGVKERSVISDISSRSAL